MYEVILLFLMKQALRLSFLILKAWKTLQTHYFGLNLFSVLFIYRSRDRKIPIIKFRDHDQFLKWGSAITSQSRNKDRCSDRRSRDRRSVTPWKCQYLYHSLEIVMIWNPNIALPAKQLFCMANTVIASNSRELLADEAIQPICLLSFLFSFFAQRQNLFFREIEEESR